MALARRGKTEPTNFPRSLREAKFFSPQDRSQRAEFLRRFVSDQ